MHLFYFRIAHPQFDLCRWPSMQGGFTPKTRTLKLQLRASQMCAPAGQTFWSSPVRLDALGGAAVVSVPCPMQNSAHSLRSPAIYMLAITATQVGCHRQILSLQRCLGNRKILSMPCHSCLAHSKYRSFDRACFGRQLFYFLVVCTIPCGSAWAFRAASL